MSTAVTQGIRVTVNSRFVPERSSPARRQYFFEYHVRIANEGQRPAQLRSRHWIITDGDGKVQEVRGDGVVGEQPRLGPGEVHEYRSYCVLETAYGSMRGSYRMVRDNGDEFDAEIAPFALAMPHALN